MSISQRYDDICSKLESIGQKHLVAFWDELNEAQKENLLGQLEALEYECIEGWVRDYVRNDNPLEIPTEFSPAPYFPAPATDNLKGKYAEARAFGEKLISRGKVGAFVVAGGQGTRLGFGGPKGNFPTSPIKGKTLFQLFAETISFAQRKYGAIIPWYIMTSPLNHTETLAAFEENDYFGLNKADVFMFQQGTMPNFAFDGKILLSDKDELAKSPDGHGGSLKALYVSGAVTDMKRRGVEQLSYFQVDNPLIKIIDPLFIGLHALAEGQMSSKTLIKAYPNEKVGNFCLVDGRVTVIEYSDLPDEQAERKNADGSLVFQLGSIAIHMISREFLEEINAEGFALPFHKAIKKIPYINEAGETVNPKDVNGVKLETFVFDALPMATHSIILETLREEEFAPVKNAEGLDSPAVTREMMIARAANWLEEAGVSVPRDETGKVACVIEMSPLFAAGPEDIAAKKDSLPEFEQGGTYYIE
ncbi:MAG: UTP--glucose-1-phosphate uridylyltransferase [Phycisphaerae bacterium]|jgi:UDP-N-acetylglucosamine/UDP-N-acetylgalactosamine diphosphorylase